MNTKVSLTGNDHGPHCRPEQGRSWCPDCLSVLIPPPCPHCGWQYPEAVLDAFARGQTTLDENPTHLCRPQPDEADVDDQEDKHKFHAVTVGIDGTNTCECGDTWPNMVGRTRLDTLLNAVFGTEGGSR